MREIKFRGKRPHSGKWITGGYVQKGIFAYILGNGHFEIECSTEVLPETVGQFTGLRDRKRTKKFPKGQEIWEWDIVKVDRQDSFPSYNQAIVVYAENHGAFLIHYTKETNPKGILSMESISSQDGKTIFDYCTGWKLEVIGNIFENPELLNRKEQK